MSDSDMYEGWWMLPFFVAILALGGILIALLASLSK